MSGVKPGEEVQTLAISPLRVSKYELLLEKNLKNSKVNLAYYI